MHHKISRCHLMKITPFYSFQSFKKATSSKFRRIRPARWWPSPNLGPPPLGRPPPRRHHLRAGLSCTTTINPRPAPAAAPRHPGWPSHSINRRPAPCAAPQPPGRALPRRCHLQAGLSRGTSINRRPAPAAAPPSPARPGRIKFNNLSTSLAQAAAPVSALHRHRRHSHRPNGTVHHS